MPNKDEIAFALELFDEIVDPTLTKLEALLEENVSRDAAWRNDYCRFLLFVQEAFSGIAALAKEEATDEERDVYYHNTDLPYALSLSLSSSLTSYCCSRSIQEMVARAAPIETGYPLNDLKDPRHIKVMSYRRRFADFLLRSSRVLRQQGEENTVDAIHTLVRKTHFVSFIPHPDYQISSFRTYLLENGSADVDDWGYLRNRFNEEKGGRL